MLQKILNFKYLLFISACPVLFSCNQQPKGLTGADVARMLDSVKTAAKEEAKKELKEEYETQKIKENTNTSYQQTPSTTTSYSTSSSSSTSHQEPSESLSEKAYILGVRDGKGYHTVDLNYLLKENEKQLKNRYMNRCSGSGKSEYYLPEEQWDNKDLYFEYKRGFLKGYENANNAL